MSELKKLLQGVEVEWKELEEVAIKISSGGTPKTNTAAYYNGNIPWLRTQEVGYGNIWDTEVKITEKGLNNSSAKLIPINCVIIAMYGATVGRVSINKIPLSTNQACANIELNKEIVKYRYVFHVLRSKYDYIKSLGTGPQTNINAGIVKKLQIPIPYPDQPEKSLKIQEEIVRILDSLSEETNKLTTALQNELNSHQKRYEYHLAELFKFEGKEVEWKTLKEVAEIGTGRRNTNEAIPNGKYPFFVRSQIPRTINEYEFDETAIITAGDGVGVGKVFHYIEGKYALHQRAYRIVARDKEINSKYLFYYMRNTFSKYIEKISVHASVTSLRKPMFEKYPTPIPSLKEQERLVKIIDKLDITTQSITTEIKKEIELRNKQYEYYRDQLLSFPK